MKHKVTVLIVMGLAITLLLGCGGSGKSGNSNNTGNSAQAQPKAEGASTSTDPKYVIQVQDADDATPIPGVKVQLCTDTQCMMGQTGDDGAAYFDAEPADYTAHVLKAPAEYEGTSEELTLSADVRTATFALHKASTTSSEASPAPAEAGDASAEDASDSGISFETTDLDGNAVTSTDLFAGHKLTMINFWATWCEPCKDELPDLEKLHQDLSAKKCQIIGICEDAGEGSDITAAAKEILAKAGVTYTNLVATNEMLQMMPHMALPTSFFVDSKGHIVTEPVIGASFSQYNERIEEALKALGE